MAWSVLHYHTRLSSQEDGVLKWINGLIAGGAEVYGSADGTNFDNSGSGATNYWTDEAAINNIGAWIRLRWPSAGGAVREMCMRLVNTFTRYEIYWSSNGTGFTGGSPSATVRPTATDEQFTANGTNFLFRSYSFPSTPSVHLDLIVGDADEGYSWLMGVMIPTKAGYDTACFMDVLDRVPDANNDADPCVYATMPNNKEFPNSSRNDEFFNDLIVGNDDTNIAGWFHKDDGDQAWVCYPIGQWGSYSNSGSADNFSDNYYRQQDRVLGWYEHACYYIRGGNNFASERGPKGRSRLFALTRQACHIGVNPDLTRRHIGRGLTIPWDGQTEAREM